MIDLTNYRRESLELGVRDAREENFVGQRNLIRLVEERKLLYAQSGGKAYEKICVVICLRVFSPSPDVVTKLETKAWEMA